MSALDDARIPHAFGGALALAWCTQRARGTIDIDVNVFVDRSRTAQYAQCASIHPTNCSVERRGLSVPSYPPNRCVSRMSDGCAIHARNAQ